MKPEDTLTKGGEVFHPGFSVDCAIFGFHQNQLKVLLLKTRHSQDWALPGGFVFKDEDVSIATNRILEARTGLNNIFLKQFHLFGDVNRTNRDLSLNILNNNRIQYDNNHWFLQRFITVGYYALIDYSKATPKTDSISDACEWRDLDKIPSLIHDHLYILQQALEVIRSHINYHPIGYNLLPEKFTMPELQKLYETILGKQLDRRNFQRKIIGFGIVKRLDEIKKGGAHKAPYLYSFIKENYEKALERGLNGGW